MSKVVDKFWNAIGDIQQLDIENALKLKEELIHAITTIEMMEGALCETETTNKYTNPKRGDEIKEFYFVGETRAGCPKIEKRAIGIKGITLIEISNVGGSYNTDKHLSKVRVTGVKEDGETPYTLFFTNVFTEVTDALIDQYANACKKHKALLGQLQNQITVGISAHYKIMKETYNWLYKKQLRTQK